jgi:hypothetical protein
VKVVAFDMDINVVSEYSDFDNWRSNDVPKVHGPEQTVLSMIVTETFQMDYSAKFWCKLIFSHGEHTWRFSGYSEVLEIWNVRMFRDHRCTVLSVENG